MIRGGGVALAQSAPLLDFKVLHEFFLPDLFYEIRVNPWRKNFPGAEERSTGSLGSYRHAARDVLQLLCTPATHRTVLHHVGVQMTATAALDGVR